ncbi:MAG: hypothetical protein V1735_06860 [Nanoarchaeota archaeon]
MRLAPIVLALAPFYIASCSPSSHTAQNSSPANAFEESSLEMKAQLLILEYNFTEGKIEDPYNLKDRDPVIYDAQMEGLKVALEAYNGGKYPALKGFAPNFMGYVHAYGDLPPEVKTDLIAFRMLAEAVEMQYLNGHMQDNPEGGLLPDATRLLREARFKVISPACSIGYQSPLSK